MEVRNKNAVRDDFEVSTSRKDLEAKASRIVPCRGTADSEAYHLSELRIASSENDPRRILPLVPPGCERILDVGCGAGQTLIASKLPSSHFLCGIDIDRAALQLGHRIAPSIHFVLARGESIPFRANFFDMVICRVALPYLRIDTALDEFYRVLNPAGVLWLALHSFAHTVAEIRKSLCVGNLKDVVFRFYVLANGLSLYATNRQFRFPFGQRRLESCQTTRGIRKSLHSHGFRQINVSRSRHFVVTATKGP